MSPPFPNKAVAVALAVFLGGCASQSELTALRLDRDHPQYRSDACQTSLEGSTLHRDIKSVTMVATPVLLVVSGGLLLPVLAANAGLDTLDRVDASNMANQCGGRGESGREIAGSVAAGAAVSAVTGLAPK